MDGGDMIVKSHSWYAVNLTIVITSKYFSIIFLLSMIFPL